MAARLAQDLTHLEPGQPIGHAFTGKFLLARNEPRQALPYLQKAWQLAPNDAVNCYMYGVALRTARSWSSRNSDR